MQRCCEPHDSVSSNHEARFLLGKLCARYQLEREVIVVLALRASSCGIAISTPSSDSSATTEIDNSPF